MKRKLSLKGQALALLAQREHSRSEMRVKLLRRLTAERKSASGTTDEAPAAVEGAASQDTLETPEAVVEPLLDWLEAHRYLSQERFVESRIHARQARFGNLRLRQELARHGVSVDAAQLQSLRDSELARARAVWLRKFGQPPADAAERARQMRFLAGRGFSAEVVQRVVRGGAEDDAP